MLEALLHRTLDESIDEPQRLEDALTSTVFGMRYDPSCLTAMLLT